MAAHGNGGALDNLTHGLVGAALGKAGGERVTPLATATLVIAANAPDIDVFSYVKGEYFALSFRRGITHGWPAMLLLPFVVTAVMLAWDRWMRRRRNPSAEPARPTPLLALAAVGVATHPALDWMNTYGMRWGLPFDGSWSYGDALFIIDPWIWLVLGGTVFVSSRPDRGGFVAWGLLATVASLPILLFPLSALVKVLWLLGLATIVGTGVARRSRVGSPRPPRLGLTALCVYIALMVTSDLVARRQVLETARAHGLSAHDVMVAPQPANPLTAEVEVRTEAGYVPGDHRWLRDPRVRLYPADVVPHVERPSDLDGELAEALLESARAHPDVAAYLVWARYPLGRISDAGNGRWTVTFSDARYDEMPGAGGLSGLSVTLTREDLR